MKSILGSKAKREIEKAAEKAICSGQSHKEAFASLAKDFHNKEQLFEALSNTPTIPLRKRYKIWNYLLAVLLFTTWSTLLHAVLIDIRTSIVLVSFYFFFLIRSVLKWRIKHYFWIAVLSGFFTLLAVGFTITEPKNLNDIHTQLLIPHSIALFILSIWLERKLLPKTYSEKVKEKDENDRLVFKKVFRFEGK